MNVLPKLGSTVAKFFGNVFTDAFNSIYNQQIDQKSARNVIIGFFVIAVATTVIIAGFNTYKNYDVIKNKIVTKKADDKKPIKENKKT